MTAALAFDLRVTPDCLQPPKIAQPVALQSDLFETIMAGSLADAVATSRFLDTNAFIPQIRAAFPDAWRVLEAGRVSPDQRDPEANMLLRLLRDDRLVRELTDHEALKPSENNGRQLLAPDAFANVGLHCIAVALGVLIMTDRLGVTTAHRRPLATVALLHDANKGVELAVRSFWDAMLVLNERDPALRQAVFSALRDNAPAVADALDTKSRPTTELYPAIVQALTALSIPRDLAACMDHCGKLTSPRGIFSLVECVNPESVIIKAQSAQDVANLLQRHVDDLVFSPTTVLAREYGVDTSYSAFIPPFRRALLSRFGSGSHDWMRKWTAYVSKNGDLGFAETDDVPSDTVWRGPAGSFTQAANSAIGSLLAGLAGLEDQYSHLPSDARVAAYISSKLIDPKFSIERYLE